MFGISRGWWRLSLVLGAACLIATLLWIGLPIASLYELPILFMLRIIATFGILPAAFVLMIGWIVAGFRRE